jgi:hypothetical protein
LRNPRQKKKEPNNVRLGADAKKPCNAGLRVREGGVRLE